MNLYRLIIHLQFVPKKYEIAVLLANELKTLAFSSILPNPIIFQKKISNLIIF